MGTQSLNLLFKGSVRSLAEYDVDTRLCAAPRLSQGGRFLTLRKAHRPSAQTYKADISHTVEALLFGISNPNPIGPVIKAKPQSKSFTPLPETAPPLSPSLPIH